MKNKSVLLGILIIVVVIFATGCMFSSLKPQDFKEHFGALGYIVSDTEEPKYDTGTSYLVATKEDVPFKIEYYEFDEEVEAKKIYKKYETNLKDYLTTSSKNNATTGALFSRLVAVSDNEYIVISRVKNTLIFVAGTNDYSKEINKLLEEINY
ncbi:MAG: hypothetical protein E7161_00375 [Firmicutes bacterium]|nr:hypothetical protein [Bacillota bacterium]